MKLSIVVPCYNEEESIPELFQNLETVMRRHGYDYEYIFIDDGSTDRTIAVLREMRRYSERVGIISFRRNYGKSAALNTAFRAVDGDVVITMDGDLQDDPEEIPNLLAKLDEGVDLVSGWKTDPFFLWPSESAERSSPCRPMHGAGGFGWRHRRSSFATTPAFRNQSPFA